jgi:hypothetical protein
MAPTTHGDPVASPGGRPGAEGDVSICIGKCVWQHGENNISLLICTRASTPELPHRAHGAFPHILLGCHVRA